MIKQHPFSSFHVKLAEPSAAQAGIIPFMFLLLWGSLHKPWFSLCWRWFIPAASSGIPSALSGTLQMSSFCLATGKGQQNQVYGVPKLSFALSLFLSLSFSFLPKQHLFPCFTGNILIPTTFFFYLFFLPLTNPVL